MYLEQLALQNFRNYTNVFLHSFSKMNIFYGLNAQGKTNLLEAIYVLCTLQSFRTAQRKDLIHWQSQAARVEGHLRLAEIQKKYAVVVEPSAKTPRINDKEVYPLSAYREHLNVICFCPLDMQILQGGPHLRRRYLDRILFSFNPLYAHEAGKYIRVLLQRNRALQFGNKEEVLTWGETLINYGAKIISKRLQFIEKLNTLTSNLYHAISGTEESLNVRYKTAINVCDFNYLSESDLGEKLRVCQQQLCSEEQRQKRSLVGPHLDDFEVFVGHKNLKHFGSQGEQRTAILTLKLTEFLISREEKKTEPIFLLDDISSELDEHRRNFLFTELNQQNAQVFLTSTQNNLMDLNQHEARIYEVQEGKILRK